MKLDIKPRYEVEKLEGSYKRKVAKYVAVKNDDGEPTGRKELTYVEVETPRGYMVYFPNGSSIHVATEAELKRMGYDKQPGLFEANTGEEIEGGGADLSLKSHSERTTRHSNRAGVRKAG